MAPVTSRGRSLHQDVLLLFAATGGALAWTLQLWLGWLIADLGCRVQLGEFELLGIGTAGLWLLIGAVTGAVALAAAWVAWRLARTEHADEQRRPHGARRFIAATALSLNLLLVGTIALGTSAPLFVPPCA